MRERTDRFPDRKRKERVQMNVKIEVAERGG